jgi:hypothetical protein
MAFTRSDFRLKFGFENVNCGAFTESPGLTVYAAALFLNQQNVVLWERSVVAECDFADSKQALVD